MSTETFPSAIPKILFDVFQDLKNAKDSVRDDVEQSIVMRELLIQCYKTKDSISTEVVKVVNGLHVLLMNIETIVDYIAEHMEDIVINFRNDCVEIKNQTTTAIANIHSLLDNLKGKITTTFSESKLEKSHVALESLDSAIKQFVPHVSATDIDEMSFDEEVMDSQKLKLKDLLKQYKLCLDEIYKNQDTFEKGIRERD